MRSVRDAVVLLDTKGLICDANASFERLFGWRETEVNGKDAGAIFKFFDLDGKKPIENQFENVLVRGITWQSAEPIVIKNKRREDCFVTFKAVPMFGPDSRVFGAYLILEDKNERVRLETEMLKTQKMESIGVLAGGIAHDFNNLLTAIVGNLSMVSALAGDDSPTSPQIKAAETATHRAKNLAQQLLTMCHAETKVREHVALNDVLKESCTLMTSGTQCSVQFELPSDPLTIKADEDQISQVINNLVINAVQAMDGVGEVTVSARDVLVGRQRAETLAIQPGSFVEIAVRDNGPGISEEVLAKVFSPFFTTKDNGNGLGLASCRTIVRRHGGALCVDSELGLGATFTCLIPSAQGETKKSAKIPQTIAPFMRSGKGHILVMDDEEMIRQIAADMLSILGYDSEVAKDGEEMLAMYQEAAAAGNPFDLVVMDLTIPGGMGGKEAAGKLLEIDPNACAVVSSGYSNDPIMEGPPAYGFIAAIQKPYTVQELSNRMEELVALSRSRQEEA